MEQHRRLKFTERSFGYLVFPNPEGGDDDHHQLGRRVYVDHPDRKGIQPLIGLRFRDIETHEVAFEGQADEARTSVVEVEPPKGIDHVLMYPGRQSYYLNDKMVAQYVPAVARGLIAFGEEKLKPEELIP
jgi:hypothetical protein